MSFFKKLFEKKICDICGEEIGLLGNRKLEDGNMCKDCAKKLSPFFSERRQSTIEDIKQQLEYREENKNAVASFNVTRVLGDSTKIYLDEDAGKFMVTNASQKNIAEENPDVIDFASVTNVSIDIDEDKREEKTRDKDGNMVSYNPPRYIFSYDISVTILVNHPYFDEINVRLNSSDIQINRDYPVTMLRKPDPNRSAEYLEYMDMANDIKTTLTTARTQAREEIKSAAAPKQAVVCPWCGATTKPDKSGCCEYCGGAING